MPTVSFGTKVKLSAFQKTSDGKQKLDFNKSFMILPANAYFGINGAVNSMIANGNDDTVHICYEKENKDRYTIHIKNEKQGKQHQVRSNELMPYDSKAVKNIILNIYNKMFGTKPEKEFDLRDYFVGEKDENSIDKSGI